MADTKGDRLSERLVRKLARNTSRRSLLSKLGGALVAAPVFPLLPVARAAGQAPLSDFERRAQTKDGNKCDYWRHCALDGIICGCCGGGSSRGSTARVGTSSGECWWLLVNERPRILYLGRQMQLL
jgi:methylamine dehydrogenase light chain